MRELALFAGAGGGLLASRLLGFETVAAVEIEPFCREVLQARQADGMLEDFPIYEDVRTFDSRPWRGRVDIVTGGWPCQDISLAGKGGGIDAERGSLWRAMWEIACDVGAGCIFVENSAEVLAEGMGTILGALASRGWDAEWLVLGAGHVGAPHIRERLWLLASDPDSTAGSQLQTPRLVPDVFGDHARLAGRWADEPGRAFGHPWREGRPRVRGVDDGLADRMDRLGAIGNGQVPRVAAAAFSILWSRLMEGENVRAG